MVDVAAMAVTSAMQTGKCIHKTPEGHPDCGPHQTEPSLQTQGLSVAHILGLRALGFREGPTPGGQRFILPTALHESDHTHRTDTCPKELASSVNANQEA